MSSVPKQFYGLACAMACVIACSGEPVGAGPSNASGGFASDAGGAIGGQGGNYTTTGGSTGITPSPPFGCGATAGLADSHR